MKGIIRLAVLVAWALVVFAVGGAAVRAGISPVLTGGVELLALILGVAGILATPLWRRSINQSREQAGIRY